MSSFSFDPVFPPILSLFLFLSQSAWFLSSFLVHDDPFLLSLAGIPPYDSCSFGPAQHQQVNVLVTNAPCSYVPPFIMRTYIAVLPCVCVILCLCVYSTRVARTMRVNVRGRAHAPRLNLGQPSRCRSTAFFIYLRHWRPNEISIKKSQTYLLET